MANVALLRTPIDTIFFKKISRKLDLIFMWIACLASAQQTIHVKYQDLFYNVICWNFALHFKVKYNVLLYIFSDTAYNYNSASSKTK